MSTRFERVSNRVYSYIEYISTTRKTTLLEIYEYIFKVQFFITKFGIFHVDFALVSYMIALVYFIILFKC